MFRPGLDYRREDRRNDEPQAIQEMRRTLPYDRPSLPGVGHGQWQVSDARRQIDWQAPDDGRQYQGGAGGQENAGRGAGAA